MPESNEPIIRFSKVSKTFAQNVVYKDLSLEIFRGETLTVIGSGVGKSVMLKLLIRLMEPDSGTIEAFGKDVSKRWTVKSCCTRAESPCCFKGLHCLTQCP